MASQFDDEGRLNVETSQLSEMFDTSEIINQVNKTESEIKGGKKQMKGKKLEMRQFKCELIAKIELNNYFSLIGNAWSGINPRLGKKPQFLYGTDNGEIVKLEMESLHVNQAEKVEKCDRKQDKQAYEMEREDNTYEKQDKQAYQMEGEDNTYEKQDDVCSISSAQKQQIFEEESPEIVIDQGGPRSHKVKLQIIKLFDENKPCYQVGQIGKYIVISSKENQAFVMRFYNREFKEIGSERNSVASYHFSCALGNKLVYRDISSWDECPKLVFSIFSSQNLQNSSQNSDGFTQKKLKQWTLKSKDMFPTSILSFEYLVFVGLFTKKVLMYNTRSNKLVLVLDPEIDSYVKKLALSPCGQVIGIISLKDQVVIMNTFQKSIMKSFSLIEIFSRAGFPFLTTYELYLFTFIDAEVVVLGGSFPYIFFINWKTLRILRIHKDEGYFVGILFHKNLVYLTHEKNSYISILE